MKTKTGPTTSYWRFYYYKQKSHELEEELSKLRGELDNLRGELEKIRTAYRRLVAMFVAYLDNRVLSLGDLQKIREALDTIEKSDTSEFYKRIAPICKRVLSNLEQKIGRK
jgi:predicted nuclease with TOPRIM domain